MALYTRVTFINLKPIDEIKQSIASKYSDTSENGIKARLICDAYLTTRIDLTKLENGKIVFVELKHIDDGRLLTKDYGTKIQVDTPRPNYLQKCVI